VVVVAHRHFHPVARYHMDFVKHHAPGEMGENSRTSIKRDVTRATVDRDHSTRQQFDNVFLQWRSVGSRARQHAKSETRTDWRFGPRKQGPAATLTSRLLSSPDGAPAEPFAPLGPALEKSLSQRKTGRGRMGTEGWVKRPSIYSLSEPKSVRCDGCHTATGFVGAEAANRPAAPGRGDLPSGR
jgi:hypothetical protein